MLKILYNMNFAPFAYFKSPEDLSPAPGPIITTNLFLHLDSNNSTSYPSTGTTWFDLTTNNYNATLINNPTFNSGTPSFFAFDGVDDQASTPPASRLTETTSFTFGAWVKFTVNTRVVFLTRNKDVSGVTGGWSLMLDKSTTNTIAAKCVVISPTAQINAQGSTVISLNTWYYIVGTFTSAGTASNLSVYINGTSEASTNINRGTLRTSGNDSGRGWFLGVDGATPNKSDVSEVHLYNTVLTQTQIQNNFNERKIIYGY
jgi:hypothetical protein